MKSRESEDYWTSSLEARLPGFDAPNNHAQIETIHTALKHELDSMVRAMSVTARRCNAILPALRLPPELVLRIFSLYAIVEPPGRSDRHRGTDSMPQAESWPQFRLGWIKVTHVCHRWRAIALEDACLWANIECSLGVPWVKVMLSRAGGAPLGLCVLTNPRTNSEKDGPGHSVLLSDELSLAQHTSRIGRLVIRGQKTLAAVTPWLCDSLPVLHTVALDLTEGRSHYLSSRAFSNAPALRRLFLIGCTIFGIRASTTEFPGLTHLRISPSGFSSRAGIPHNGDHFDPVSDYHHRFYTCLKTMTNLQYLALEMCLPGHADLSRVSIELRSLRYLAITGRTLDCADFMARVTIPPTTTLRLVCYSFTDSAVESVVASGILRTFFMNLDRSSSPSQAWHCINISSHSKANGYNISFEAYNWIQKIQNHHHLSSRYGLGSTVSPPPRPYDPSFIGDPCQLAFEWVDATGQDAAILDRVSIIHLLVDAFPVDNGMRLLFLDVEESINWTPELWLDLSARFKEVQEIRITSNQALRGFCLLSLGAGEDSATDIAPAQSLGRQPDESVFFPKLTHLRVPWRMVVGQGSLAGFLGYLEARQSAGNPLDELTLEGDPFYSQEWLDKYRGSVRKLNARIVGRRAL